MFQSARIKLTLWYTLVAILITGFFSFLAYQGFRLEIERGLQRQRVFIERRLNILPPEQRPLYLRRVDPDLLNEARERVLASILTIDIAIVAISAVAGYFLAGRTLRPIKDMLDEQKRFIADASHELRTPLTAIRTETEVALRDKSLSLPLSKKILQSNLEEISTIQLLSDRLLRLSQFQDNGKKPVSQTVSLKEIIGEAIKKISPLAKTKEIIITSSIKNVHVQGDRQNLVELFVIFLDNAVKYSPAKSMISIDGEEEDGKIITRIKDNGFGIPREDIQHIFDRFYRVEKSRSKHTVSGYGLGLSIAKKIVEEHEGIITVKSSVNKGTTFTLQFPTKTQEIVAPF